MKYFKPFYLFYYFVLCFITPAGAENDYKDSQFNATKFSENESFKVSYSSELKPIEINKIHTWIIHIENNNGLDVLNADVQVIGGMPEHDHGLPTQPKITKNLGDGYYLLEGMRFHMLGAWTVSFTIQHENIIDSVTFNFRL